MWNPLLGIPFIPILANLSIPKSQLGFWKSQFVFDFTFKSNIRPLYVVLAIFSIFESSWITTLYGLWFNMIIFKLRQINVIRGHDSLNPGYRGWGRGFGNVNPGYRGRGRGFEISTPAAGAGAPKKAGAPVDP